jgi:EAL domain-containing protein (putative c-di-GMP-specific phosphodiesterase class I)/CHASE2 domain-containing sensor protein
MRTVLWAIGIAVIAGVIELGLPAEDMFRAVRAEIRTHDAPSDIVVVTIDDKTLNELKSDVPDRKRDAELVNVLFKAGATRVFFDKAYADPSNPVSDAAFANALASHDQVYLGAAPASEEGIERYDVMMPSKLFRDRAKLASMVGEAGPFDLSYRFPTSEKVGSETIPSISAGLAGYKGTHLTYRPDFGIDIHSIANISYIDVLKGRFDPQLLKGSAVVVGQTFSGSSDRHYEPLGSKIPGVYFHALGAHTLREGTPIDLGWVPALLISATILLLQASRRTPRKSVSAATAAGLIIAPLALDYVSIGIDVFPALLALGVGMIGLERHARRMFDEKTGCLRVEALESEDSNPRVLVFALKIKEFSFITRNSSNSVIVDFIRESARRLSATEGGVEFAFHKDTVIWLRPKLESTELSEHLSGLRALFRRGIGHGGTAVDIAAHIGVDENYSASIRSRIATAIQSAEDALHAGTHAIVANTEYLDVRDKRLTLLSDLDEAMARNSVQVAYQPKVELSSGRIVGAEALLRWTHHEHGAVPPEELVAMAEAHSRIDDLTMYVIDTALAAARMALQIDPKFQIAVNVSAIALTRVKLIYDMTYLMSKHRIPAENIILEVTETASLDDRRVEAVMNALREFGIHLAIDDFGTGQCTLSYIKRIPGTEVKIDRSFVSDMKVSAESRSVVQATIDMARRLGRRAVAEGVEDRETAKMLAEMGCEYAQGFLYAKAIPINELLKDMRKMRIAA